MKGPESSRGSARKPLRRPPFDGAQGVPSLSRDGNTSLRLTVVGACRATIRLARPVRLRSRANCATHRSLGGGGSQACARFFVRRLRPCFHLLWQHGSLGGDGAPQCIAFEDSSGSAADLNLFRSTIENAMKESRFEPACAGKTVRVGFEFRIGRERPVAVYFVAPNRFEIEAEPQLINTAR